MEGVTNTKRRGDGTRIVKKDREAIAPIERVPSN